MNPKSLGERRADWQKVVEVWFKIADFVNDPKNLDEAAKIMGARVGQSGDEYKKLMKGTAFLGLDGNLKGLEEGRVARFGLRLEQDHGRVLHQEQDVQGRREVRGLPRSEPRRDHREGRRKELALNRPLAPAEKKARRHGPGLLAVREPLPTRASFIAGILAFAMPFALWCIV